MSAVLIAGVNLYALAIVLEALLGWPLVVAILVSAALVLAYITLGGLSSAIYNEVLQFFVILAGLIPLVVVGLHDMGGWSGLTDKVAANKNGGDGFLHTWQGNRCRRRDQPARLQLDRHHLRARASCCPSATGPRTSPRCSGRCRRAT